MAVAVELFRWVFPYLLFISLTSLYAGVLNSYQRFALPAFTQVIQNVVMIVAAVWLASGSEKPGLVLAIGVFGGVSTALALVARDSADVWARQRQFRLDASVGAPPDAGTVSRTLEVPLTWLNRIVAPPGAHCGTVSSPACQVS